MSRDANAIQKDGGGTHDGGEVDAE